jgi:hypothetical protein
MELDPGIHIVMHSVLSLKPGLTELEAPRITNTKSIGSTKSEVLKGWEISLLALSYALPSISLQSPHQISLGSQRRE